MPNDDPQPEPAAARDFAAETADKLLRQAIPDKFSADGERAWQAIATGVRAGLRRAAEIARGQDDGGRACTDNVQWNMAAEAIADAIEREAGAA